MLPQKSTTLVKAGLTAALAQVRHQTAESKPKLLKVRLGDGRVCTTFAVKMEMRGQADAELAED